MSQHAAGAVRAETKTVGSVLEGHWGSDWEERYGDLARELGVDPDAPVTSPLGDGEDAAAEFRDALPRHRDKIVARFERRNPFWPEEGTPEDALRAMRRDVEGLDAIAVAELHRTGLGFNPTLRTQYEVFRELVLAALDERWRAKDYVVAPWFHGTAMNDRPEARGRVEYLVTSQHQNWVFAMDLFDRDIPEVLAARAEIEATVRERTRALRELERSAR